MNKPNLKLDLNVLKADLLVAAKLTLICFSAVLLLSIAHLLTQGAIDRNSLRLETATNRYLMPDGEFFEKHSFQDENVRGDSEYYYEVCNADNQIIGYTVSVVTSGYGGAMKLMAGFDRDLIVKNAKLLANSETPGIGKRAEQEGYMDMFIGTGSADRPVPANKSMAVRNGIDAVTGATITFNGVSSGIIRAASLLANRLGSTADTDETSDE